MSWVSFLTTVEIFLCAGCGTCMHALICLGNQNEKQKRLPTKPPIVKATASALCIAAPPSLSLPPPPVFCGMPEHAVHLLPCYCTVFVFEVRHPKAELHKITAGCFFLAFFVIGFFLRGLRCCLSGRRKGIYFCAS